MSWPDAILAARRIPYSLTILPDQYKAAGLDLFEKSGLQHFDIVTDIETGPGNQLEFDGQTLEAGSGF